MYGVVKGDMATCDDEKNPRIANREKLLAFLTKGESQAKPCAEYVGTLCNANDGVGFVKTPEMLQQIISSEESVVAEKAVEWYIKLFLGRPFRSRRS
jgi:hypothetical protein